LCEAQFSDVGNLRRHKMTKHEGVKYNCDQCDEEFTEQGNLKRHKLTKHEGIRYDCDQCEARFYDQNTLKKHQLTKHEGMKLDKDGMHCPGNSYRCQICGFKCGKKPNLRSHIKRRHCTDSLSMKELEEMYPEMYKCWDPPGEGDNKVEQQQQAAMKYPGVAAAQGNGLPNHYLSAKQEQPDAAAAQAWAQQSLSQTSHMVPQSVGGMGQVGHMGGMGSMGGMGPAMAGQAIPQLPQKKYLAKQQPQHSQHEMAAANHGAKFHHEPRYIPGEQERLMQEQQQRLAVAGLMQEYCNQVMPGFDQNERYLLEQRERERLAHEQREREQRERYSSLQLPFSLPTQLQADPRLGGGAGGRAPTGVTNHHQALDHRLPQVAPLDARMFQGQHHRDASLAPDRLASNTLTEMYQRMRTFNQ